MQKRFGNPQVPVLVYMDSLLKLEKVKSSVDVANFRQLSIDVETNCVCNLTYLDV